MDEFDRFDPDPTGEPFDDPGLDDQTETSPAFDPFDDAEVPAGDDFDPFDDFDSGAETIETEPLGPFDVETDLDAPEDPTGPGEETAYTATAEDLLVDRADNPPAFPPELDLDLPEPVDGYPWVDLDTLGAAETEPWVNTVDDSAFAEADLDDPAAEALARFWQM
ncbi:hypothetical protein GCM10027447_30300 [Glycomyces halotolerans]